MFANHSFDKVKRGDHVVRQLGSVESAPLVCEGSEVYNTICPVSKLTGKRENPLRLLKRITNDPVKARLLNGILQDIPAIRSNPKLTDSDRIALLTERLSSGSPSEDERNMKYLESISDVLFKNAPQAVKEEDNPIDFKPTDAPSNPEV